MGKEGASIQEMNIVRQLISKIKGGKLSAAAAPTRVRVDTKLHCIVLKGDFL